MNELPLPVFRHAIKALLGVESRLIERVRVEENLGGSRVWEGDVLVFELLGHPAAPKCYAWEVDGELTAVLQEPPLDSPQAAVRASIMADETAAEAQ